MSNAALKRRVVLATACLWIALPAAAQTYPSRPIRIIVPYAAGGSTDQLARAIQQPMSDFLGQPVIVENKPGAGGTDRASTLRSAKSLRVSGRFTAASSTPSELETIIKDEVSQWGPVVRKARIEM